MLEWDVSSNHPNPYLKSRSLHHQVLSLNESEDEREDGPKIAEIVSKLQVTLTLTVNLTLTLTLTLSIQIDDETIGQGADGLFGLRNTDRERAMKVKY